MGYKVAVVGATGNVGREMLNILDERKFRAGKDAMDELFSQTKAVYTNSELINKKFPKRIAFNVIPHIDVFMEDGYTKEEWKMMMETKKILDPKIRLTATCVRVPVFVGHSEAVNI